MSISRLGSVASANVTTLKKTFQNAEVRLSVSQAVGDTLKLSTKNSKAKRSILSLIKEIIAEILTDKAALKGLEQARQDMQNEVISSGKNAMTNLAETFASPFKKTGSSIEKVMNNASLQKAGEEFIDSRTINSNEIVELVSNGFKSQIPQVFSELIQKVGVAPVKILQTLGSDPEFLTKCSPALRQSIESLQSSCKPTRTLVQAQQYLDEVYGKGVYLLKKQLGAGSVGESYIATQAEGGKNVIVKLLKRGVNAESLQKEEQLFLQVVNEFCEDSKQKFLQTELVKNLFKSWRSELSYANEALAAENLAKSASRYKVAKALAQKADSLVLEMAQGIPLDKLIKMIETFKANPAEFTQKYADDIQKSPWLANIDSWMEELPQKYASAINEMIMFPVPKQGGRFVHGDPHAGNVFINMLDGKLDLTFIDTGFVFERTNQEIIKHLGFMADYMTGNSESLAKRFVDKATFLSQDISKSDLVKKLTQQLDEKLFNAHINLKNFSYNQEIMDSIFENLGMMFSLEDAGFLKAQAQSILTTKRLSQACGKKVGTKFLLNDLRNGIQRSLETNAGLTLVEISPSVRHALVDKTTTMSVLGQYISK